MESYFLNVDFQETIVDNRIVFDCRLYEGRASSRNAVKLISMMGYSDAIVKEAEMRASHFIHCGTWKEIAN